MADRSRRDINQIPTLLAQSNVDNASPVAVAADPTTRRLLVDASVGFDIPSYDYLSLAQATTTDTWTYKTGGSGGSTVATVTITYTDSTKATIANVAKT